MKNNLQVKRNIITHLTKIGKFIIIPKEKLDLSWGKLSVREIHTEVVLNRFHITERTTRDIIYELEDSGFIKGIQKKHITIYGITKRGEEILKSWNYRLNLQKQNYKRKIEDYETE